MEFANLDYVVKHRVAEITMRREPVNAINHALIEDINNAYRKAKADPEVRAVTHDSRGVVPGALFCCVPGALEDGHAYAPAAVAAGAAALLVERWLDDVVAPQVLSLIHI